MLQSWLLISILLLGETAVLIRVGSDHVRPTREECAQSVRLLDGPLVIDQHGRRIGLPEGCERVLVFVALRKGHRVNRRQLAGCLWPSVPEERAAGNLRSALWRIRSSGIEAIEVDRQFIAVAASATVDIVELSDWAARVICGNVRHGDLDISRLDLARADLLPGWYDDWLVVERERLRQRLLHALEALSRLLVERGRYGEAVEAALSATEIDPLRESAHKCLMLAHLSEGNLTEARRAFESYEQLIWRALGVGPSAELASLVHPS